MSNQDDAPDAGLMAADPDGSTANNIRATPRAGGARLSKRFKGAMVVFGGVVVCGIILGVLTAGHQAPQSQTSKSTADGVGQTDPNVSDLERRALAREERNGKGMAAMAGAGNPNDPDAVGGKGRLDASVQANGQTQKGPKSPEQNYQDWLTSQYFKGKENEITIASTATSSTIGAGGYSGPSRDTAALSTLGGPATEAPGLSRALQALRQATQPGAAGAPSSPDANILASLGGVLGGSAAVANPYGPSGLGTYQTAAGNEAFAQQGDQEKNGYLMAAATPPISNRELFAGSVIPAVSLTAINSDLPGDISAMVRQTVYDSRDENAVLIPQGTKLVGEYNSAIAYGQSRVMVVWNHLIYPDGQQLNIEGMKGASSDGTSGLHDQVDNHYLRIFGSAFLISLLGVEAQLSQPQNASLLAAPSAGSQAAAAAASQLNSVGTNLLNKNLSIAPTLSIRPGFAFNIMVNKTMILPQYKN